MEDWYIFTTYNEKFSVSVPIICLTPVEIQNITGVVSRTSTQLNVRHRISFDNNMIKIDFTNVKDRDSFIGSNSIDPVIKALFRYDNFTSRLGKRFLLTGAPVDHVPSRYKDSITSDYSALECLQKF